MDFNSTIDLIIKDLDEARQIIDDLKKYPGVPALQVELAKSKCKSAGEVIALLKGMNDRMPEAVALPSVMPPETITPFVKVTPPVAITPSVKVTPAAEDTSPLVIEVPPVEKKAESIKLPERVPETAIVADKFSRLSSINDQLSVNNSDDDDNDYIKTKPITSLYEAIGLNDKFLFMKEIFDGNKDAYNQAISRLNNVDNLTDAMEIILGFTHGNNENEAVKQLLNLVKRKLPPNE